MQTLIYNRRQTAPKISELRFPYISLFQDNWNDFGWKCRFLATLHLSEAKEVKLGPVRIAKNNGSFHLKDLPAVFNRLPTSSASLGESIAYYRKIRSLPGPIRRKYLTSIRDIVANPKRRSRIKDTSLWDDCFMRIASSRHAHNRGGYYVGSKYLQAEPPVFNLTMHLPNASGPHRLDLDFSRHNDLPNRTIILVGRNGTGKTHTLSSLATQLMPRQAFTKESLVNVPDAVVTPNISISRLIAVSYNAFDEFPLPSRVSLRSPRLDGIAYKSRGSYKYCGLRGQDGIFTTGEIGVMISETLEPVVDSERVEILRGVLSTLLSPILANALTSENDDERREVLAVLSAGQRLFVSIFSNIIGFIENESLLLIDEPETNLHPGLLSTFIAALNETLEEFDSYAVVASHSPIVIQQVPSRYVRHFTRDGTDMPRIKIPNFETFGEDLGELTRRLFGLADPERDFTNVLDKLFKQNGSAEAVAELFEHSLGFPAMAHLYGLENDANEDFEQ